MKKKIVFVSTNKNFGGSEILWLETVLINKEKFDISIFIFYDHDIIDELKSKVKVYYLGRKESIINKFKNRFLNKTSDFKLLIQSIQPDLVVFSNGEPFSFLREGEIVKTLKIKYIIVNQLIADFHWLSIKKSNFFRYFDIYKTSKANFFVSYENQYRFEQMLFEGSNFHVINNPISFKVNEILKYPPIEDFFQIAFVGRFEFYHKGLDLLLNALKNNVWKQRNVIFNFYGDGPHKIILQNEIINKKLDFCKVHEFVKDVSKIWEKNHIMVLTSRFEGKSLSISEASYYGRAIISTNVGGASEQIIDGETGFLINQISTESILNTLSKAWENRFKWKEMGIKAREEYFSSIKKDPVEEFTEKIIQYSEL